MRVPPASLAPPRCPPAPGEQSWRANARCWALPGDFQLLLPDASTKSPRHCWERLPRCCPRGSAAGSACAQLSPLRPPGDGNAGGADGERRGERVREGKAPLPGDGLNLEEKASWRKKVTTRNSRKRMKCDRKLGLREITAAKNKHPKPAMGERKRSVNQKKWGCITALHPALLGPGWGERGGPGFGAVAGAGSGRQSSAAAGGRRGGAQGTTTTHSSGHGACGLGDKLSPGLSTGAEGWWHVAEGTVVPTLGR